MTVSEKRTIASLLKDTAVAANRTTPAYLVEEEGGWRGVWPEAAQAVDEIAHGLLALGVRKGDAFEIFARTRLEWSLFDFALAHVGAKVLPARLRPPASRDTSSRTPGRSASSSRG